MKNLDRPLEEFTVDEIALIIRGLSVAATGLLKENTNWNSIDGAVEAYKILSEMRDVRNRLSLLLEHYAGFAKGFRLNPSGGIK